MQWIRKCGKTEVSVVSAGGVLDVMFGGSGRLDVEDPSPPWAPSTENLGHNEIRSFLVFIFSALSDEFLYFSRIK